MKLGITGKLLLIPAISAPLLIWVLRNPGHWLPTSVALTVILVLSLWIASSIRRPLRELSGSMRQLQQNTAISRASSNDTSGELDELARNFDALAVEMQSRQDAQAAAAKELSEINQQLRNEVQDRCRTEEALNRSREFLEMAQAAGGIGIFNMDLYTGTIQGSTLFFELLGLAPGDHIITQKQWMASVFPEDLELLAHDFQQAVATGGRFSVEYRSLRADGSLLWVASSGRVISDAAAKPVRVVGSIVDISRRKKAELALVDASRSAEAANRAKSQFLANMSHEIRTPMNGVIGMTELLLDTNLDRTQREYLEIIRSSGAALLALINDVLDVSKIEAGRMELEQIDFGMREMISEIASALGLHAANKGLELVAHIHPDVPEALRGDPSRLRQILVNLVGNAIKFTPEGEIIIDIALEQSTAQRVGLRMSVTDTGIGIPADRIDQLFNAFSQIDASTTRLFGGSGLGLSIVKRLAEMMDGTVGVSSQPGKGSTFWCTVFLDLPEEEFSAAQLPETNEAVFTPSATLPGNVMRKRRSERLLVVDDSAASRATLLAQLNAHGYHCEAHAHAREVPAIVARAYKERRPFAAVLIDELMPGLDGPALADQIRTELGNKSPKLVLMSLIGTVHEAQQLSRQGFSACITKPVRESDLISTIYSVLTTDAFLSTGRVELRRDSNAPTIGTVLLAEDNPVNQRVAQRNLEKLGLKVELAANGREAVEAWARQRYDLILMDCQMPELDGYEATREIRRREPADRRTPIVALTANALTGDREACLAAGMDDYLSKPIEIDKLRLCVSRHLRPADNTQTPPSEPVDLPALRELAGGDTEFERELIATFIDSGDLSLQKIVDAVAGKDLQTVRRAAHSLKGASANLRASSLTAAAKELEQLATDENHAACEVAARKVREEYDRATNFLRSIAS